MRELTDRYKEIVEVLKDNPADTTIQDLVSNLAGQLASYKTPARNLASRPQYLDVSIAQEILTDVVKTHKEELAKGNLPEGEAYSKVLAQIVAKDVLLEKGIQQMENGTLGEASRSYGYERY